MEISPNFNPGFLGSHFNWWIGQIVDASVWSGNTLSSIHTDPAASLGWGRRYKVRIIGLHDIGGSEISDENLPWAQIIYPVTAGGGQGESYQSPNLRQGNMVFGFFLDGADMQIPVIFGVLGNNSKTALAQTIGNDRVNEKQGGTLATSGLAKGNALTNQIIVPDEGLTTVKPGGKTEESEVLKPKDALGMTQEDYKIDSIKNAKEEAENEADILGIRRDADEFREYVSGKIQNAKNAFRINSNSPNSAPKSGATRESVDSPHQLTVAQVKFSEHVGFHQIPILKPSDNKLESAIKAIQTAINNLLTKINNYIHTFQSYLDQAISIVDDIEREIEKTARQIAKYMKVLLNRMREYLMKTLNEAMAKVVSLLPQSLVFEFADIKQEILDLIYCLFNKMVDQVAAQINKVLIETLNLKDIEERARSMSKDNKPYYTDKKYNGETAMCYTESIVASVIGVAAQQIDEGVDNLLANVNKYSDSARSQLRDVDQSLEEVSSIIEEIQSSLTGAMAFVNIQSNVFGCDFNMSASAADFYQIIAGGSSHRQTARIPDNEAIRASTEIFEDLAKNPDPAVPFAMPAPNQPIVDYKNYSTSSTEGD